MVFGAEPGTPAGGTTPNFKSQPWVVFDTIAASSFLIGDGTRPAIGTNIPCINSAGEMIFFNAPGRSTANQPWYTNVDQNGQLSYGFECWAMYVLFGMPTVTPTQNIGYDLTDNAGVAGMTKLVEAIQQYSVVELQLGQENQMRWPLNRFGAGGGLVSQNTSAEARAQNGIPDGANVMKLPEPIQFPRTQNLWAKIRIAPEAFPIIGNLTAPGVGQPLSPYQYGIVGGEEPTVVSLQQPPFSVQMGLVGRRIKDTQYGQIPGQG